MSVSPVTLPPPGAVIAVRGSPSGVPDPATDPTASGYDGARETLRWQLARRALALALADPDGLGGVVLHGRHGPARDALLVELTRPDPASAAAPARPVRRIPPDADDDALVGGLDPTATLARGTPVRRPGLLDDAAGHVLLLGGAERLSTSVATRLCAWLDAPPAGGAARARPVVRVPARRRAPLVALDESVDTSALVESALGERLALHVVVPALALAELGRVTDAGHAPEDAAPRLASPADVALSDAHLESIVRLAERLGIASLRAPALACRAARASAWLGGRESVSDEDAALAVQLVLGARARSLPDVPAESGPGDAPDDASREPAAGPAADEPPHGPPDEPPDEPSTPPPPADPPANAGDPHAADDALADRALPDRLVAAVTAALPRNLLDELAAGRAAHDARAGRDAGASAASERGGRPIGTRRPRGGARRRPNLLATLKAAIPFQRLRAIEADGRDAVAPGERPPLRVRRDDLRVTRHRRPTRTTTLFVVDASGSAAMHRLAEAKGAVERLLAECYVRRDRVALVTFRGDGASLDLPPTRSLVRARRALVGLPGGGGTPLAAGLDLAAGQLERLAADGESPVGVIMTDGRANVPRDGTGGRARAREDAERAARRLARIGARLLFVDTGPRPRPDPRRLAALMGARYLPLPQLDGALLGGEAERR